MELDSLAVVMTALQLRPLMDDIYDLRFLLVTLTDLLSVFCFIFIIVCLVSMLVSPKKMLCVYLATRCKTCISAAAGP